MAAPANIYPKDTMCSVEQLVHLLQGSLIALYVVVVQAGIVLPTVDKCEDNVIGLARLSFSKIICLANQPKRSVQLALVKKFPHIIDFDKSEAYGKLRIQIGLARLSFSKIICLANQPKRSVQLAFVKKFPHIIDFDKSEAYGKLRIHAVFLRQPGCRSFSDRWWWGNLDSGVLQAVRLQCYLAARETRQKNRRQESHLHQFHGLFPALDFDCLPRRNAAPSRFVISGLYSV